MADDNLPNTIAIHRKTETNTFYTLNSLNCIIRKMNNGILDKQYVINWEIYENCLLLNDGEEINNISLKFLKKILH